MSEWVCVCESESVCVWEREWARVCVWDASPSEMCLHGAWGETIFFVEVELVVVMMMQDNLVFDFSLSLSLTHTHTYTDTNTHLDTESVWNTLFCLILWLIAGLLQHIEVCLSLSANQTPRWRKLRLIVAWRGRKKPEISLQFVSVIKTKPW